MAFNLIPGGSDMSGLITNVNQNILELKNREVTEIFKDDAGTRRVILDKDGLRTSPVGVDVVTASDDQLTFNSNQNTFKVVATGSGTIPDVTVGSPGAGNWAEGSGSSAIAHNLGYIPAIVAYIDFGSVYAAMPYNITDRVAATQVYFADYRASVDATNVYLEQGVLTMGTGITSPGLPVKYYLLQETAN